MLSPITGQIPLDFQTSLVDSGMIQNLISHLLLGTFIPCFKVFWVENDEWIVGNTISIRVLVPKLEAIGTPQFWPLHEKNASSREFQEG